MLCKYCKNSPKGYSCDIQLVKSNIGDRFPTGVDVIYCELFEPLKNKNCDFKLTLIPTNQLIYFKHKRK